MLKSPLSVKRFLAVLAATALAVAGATALCRTWGAVWRSDELVHSLFEAIATALVSFTAVLVLLRYQTRPTRSWQLLGVAMVGTALLDGVHLVLTLPYLSPSMPSEPEDLLSWSWLASRTFLAVSLLLWSARDARVAALFDDERELRAPDLRVLLVATAVWGLCVLIFALTPLPRFRSDWALVGRPVDFLPGVLFAATAYQLVRRPLWRHNAFYQCILLAVAIHAFGELLVMPHSHAVFDASFDLAHGLKVLGYGCVLAGVLHSVGNQLRQTARHLKQTSIESATLRMLFEALPDAVYFKDLNERYVLMNRQFAALLGRPELERIVGKTDEDLWPPGFARWNRERDRAVLESAEPCLHLEHRLETLEPEPTSRVLLLNKLPCRNANDDVIGVLGVIRDVTDAKRSEETLRHTQELLELATQGSSLGLWVWDIRSNHVWYSARFREMLGYGGAFAHRFPDTFESFRSRLHHEDAPRVFQAIERHITSGEPYDVRYRLRCRDGSYRWFHASGRIVESDRQGDSTKPVRMAGSIQDVDDEMRTRAQLQAVAAGLGLPPIEFPGLFERRFVLPRFNLEASIACGGMIRALGHRASDRGELLEVLTRTFAERFFEDDGYRVPAFTCVRVYLGLRTHQLPTALRQQAADLYGENILQSGEAFVVEAARAGDASARDGAPPRLFALSSVELIEQRPVVARLLQRLGMKVPGLPATPVGRLVVQEDLVAAVHIEDVAGSATLPADAAARLTEQGVVSVVAFGGALPNGERFVVELLAGTRLEAAVAQRLAHLAASIELALLRHMRLPNLLQCQIEAIDRLLRSHEIIVVEQENQLEELLRSLKEANESLKRTNEELEHFLYIASHDLRAPLRHIHLLVDWIEEDCQDNLPEASQRHFRQLRQRVGRLGMLLDSLLAYSRLGRRRGPEREIDVGEIVRQAIADLGLSGREDVRIEQPDDWPRMHCEELRLASVFRNLLGNAVEHNADCGRPLTIRLAWDEDGAFYRFRVQDDGKGIPPHLEEEAFDLFTTLVPRDTHESSGVGLAMVRKAVQLEGGRVWIEHPPEGGVAFVFTWPRDGAGGRPAADAASPHTLPLP